MSAKMTTLPAQPSAVRAFLTPRWLVTTLLVLLAAAVMVRLGIWQLERLEQRRARNAQYESVMALPALDLNQPLSPVDLSVAVYRDAVVIGRFDFDAEVVLRNQVWENRPGYHLLTPLVIEGTGQAVLVDRGWIPLEDGSPQNRAAYAETGPVSVHGRLMPQQEETKIGGAVDPELTAGQTRLDAWSWINLERISLQVTQPLLPLYLLAAPDPAGPSMTQRSLPEADLSEGPHLGYAAQWFIFALILIVGYPFYVRKQLRPRATRL
jgi:surfeit locus 1 family protein